MTVKSTEAQQLFNVSVRERWTDKHSPACSCKELNIPSIRHNYLAAYKKDVDRIHFLLPNKASM